MANKGNDRLTNKQRAFIEEYIGGGFNATEAARRAGYKGSDETLAVMGCENIRKPKIAVKVEERINELAMTAGEVLLRLKEHARGDWSEYLDETGNLKIKKLIADGKGHLIKGMKQTQWGRVIEFYDSQAALVHIGKAHGIFVDRKEISGPDGKPIPITRIIHESPSDDQ